MGPAGEAYIDLTAGGGVGAVGWGRPEIAEAIAEQARKGFYVPPFLEWPPWETLAAEVARLAPWKRYHVYRATGGSEAVEIGLKAMKSAGEGRSIATISGLYHGHTMGAAGAGDGAWSPALGPPMPGFVRIRAASGDNWNDMLSHLEELAEHSDGLTGFFTEPILTNPGMRIPPPDFWKRIKGLCRKHGLLLGLDEVVTGFGRCGAMFACELYELEPDVICLGKALSGGYAGIGATLVSEDVYAKRRFTAYSTYGWHPLSTAAALKTVEILRKDRLPERARRLGPYFVKRLRDAEGRGLAGARGQGLLAGIDVVKDDGSPDPAGAREIMRDCVRRGLIVAVISDATLFLAPALTIDEETIDRGVRILEETVRARRNGP